MLNVVELYLMVCKYSHAQGVMLVWTASLYYLTCHLAVFSCCVNSTLSSSVKPPASLFSPALFWLLLLNIECLGSYEVY